MCAATTHSSVMFTCTIYRDGNQRIVAPSHTYTCACTQTTFPFTSRSQSPNVYDICSSLATLMKCLNEIVQFLFNWTWYRRYIYQINKQNIIVKYFYLYIKSNIIKFSLWSKEEKQSSLLLLNYLISEFYNELQKKKSKINKTMSKACSDEKSEKRGSCCPATGPSWV